MKISRCLLTIGLLLLGSLLLAASLATLNDAAQAATTQIGNLEGHVTDVDSGLGIKDARVTADDGSAQQTVTTDAGGYYTLTLLNGTYTVTARATNYLSSTVSSVVVVSDTTTVQDFALQGSALTYAPAAVEASLEISQVVTHTITVTNTGPLTVHYKVLVGGLKVLILSPDDDVSDLETALTAFPDLSVTRFPKANLPDLNVSDLAPYDVVVTSNNTQWLSSGGVEPAQVGNALADYVDADGKVIANAYAYDYAGWQLAGRFIDEGYGPFTPATQDSVGVSKLGAVHELSHPLMVGVSYIANTYPWQDPSLAPGATRIADWDDGNLFLAANDDVVALNLVPTNRFGSAGWTGDLPTLYHNAILWLAARDGTSVPWVRPVPDSDAILPDSSTSFDVVFDTRALYQVGTYTAPLRFFGTFVNAPSTLPITMHLSCSICGFLEGVITDAETSASVTANIHISGTGGFDALVTGSSYAVALQPGPYDLTVTATGYLSQTARVTATLGVTVTTDFGLVPDKVYVYLPIVLKDIGP